MQELQQCLRLIKLYFSRDEFDCLGDAICEVTKFKGTVSFDRSMSEGVMHKLLDVRRINQLGWTSKINIYEGLEMTWKWLNLAHDKGHVRV